MRTSVKTQNAVFVALIATASALSSAGGCSRARYRLEADHDAYHTIAERNGDPRWTSSDYSIELDPRSRYFDANDPDNPPMPPDDPTAHSYMEFVDGRSGWQHWYDNGVRVELENPAWREALREYVALAPDGSVQLDVESAIRLAYIHSPNHQRQLESLYLSALDVSAERFRLDTQFFGSYDAQYAHTGSLVPSRLIFNPAMNRYEISPVANTIESNRLTAGASPTAQLRRRFATAGELLVGFANSFVFEFTGSDANLAASLANFSFIQPLLRGAGKDIALEQLTLNERRLLGNLRAYGQFRQGFYTQVAIGELGVSGVQRFGTGTSLQSFGGQGGVNGYLGLLQQLQEIRNTDDNLELQLRTLERLEALYNNELIDLVQVDQFRQSVESQKADLLSRQNSYELALDRYKTNTLGLPPDLPIQLDQRLINQFQLFPEEGAKIQRALLNLQAALAELPDAPEVGVLQRILTDCFQFVPPVQRLFEDARQDLSRMESVVPQRELTMTDKEKALFLDERKRLYKRFADLESGELGFQASVARLESLRDRLAELTRRDTLRGITAWVGDFRQVVERLSLVPAQARLEVITVDRINLTERDAFQVALENRLDFMNGRAALVDRWRSVQVNADALQSVLNVTADGNIQTARNNAASFRAPTGSFRMGLEFDAPFTRLLERNAYREALIEYQRSRRDFIQSQDSLQLGLRALLRNLEQLRRNLEIQRRAVTIALRRVDQTQLSLNPARPPVQPGTRAAINPTTAINLLGAQSSLQSTQNAFLSAWLSYYATRMRLYRELGIMILDLDGSWVEYPIEGAESEPPMPLPQGEEVPVPPMPQPGVARLNPVRSAVYYPPPNRASGEVRPVGHTAVGPPPLQRLPQPRDATNGYSFR